MLSNFHYFRIEYCGNNFVAFFFYYYVTEYGLYNSFVCIFTYVYMVERNFPINKS